MFSPCARMCVPVRVHEPARAHDMHMHPPSRSRPSQMRAFAAPTASLQTCVVIEPLVGVFGGARGEQQAWLACDPMSETFGQSRGQRHGP